MSQITYADKTQILAYDATKFNAQDANEIKTVVNTKADLASPAFTGAPTAPTVSSADDSTKIATTALVEDKLDLYALYWDNNDVGGLGTSGSPLVVNSSNVIDKIGSTRGSVLYRGASSWSILAPGTSGQFLKTNGAGADPTWATAAGGGSAITVQDEGSTLTAALAQLNFVGAGVTATNTGGNVTVTITGGGGSSGKLATFTSQSVATTGSLVIDLTPYTGYSQILIKLFGVTNNVSGNSLKFTSSSDNSGYAGTYVQGGTFGSDGILISAMGTGSTDNDYADLTIHRPETTSTRPRFRTYAGYQDSGNNSTGAITSVWKATSESVRYVKFFNANTTSTVTIPLVEIWGF